MKLGTIIRLPDGSEGTVVYNSLIGAGIKWGRHKPDPKDFEGSSGNLVKWDAPDRWPWEPEALLRDPWPGCERNGWRPEQCVGGEFEIIELEGQLT
ncbi:MAG TPA: hypothetical protein VMW24_06045 [Sedimentisphaerales bacterium]|nr:hypothetical protein [Sedimentisphaerales bacterium]